MVTRTSGRILATHRPAWAALLLACVFALASCNLEAHLPSKDKAAEGPSFMIDGQWQVYQGKNLTLSIDKGRIYVSDQAVLYTPSGYSMVLTPNTEIARNIKQTGPRVFSCDWANLVFQGSGKGFEVASYDPTVIELTSDRSINVTFSSSTNRTLYSDPEGHLIFIRSASTQIERTAAATTMPSEITVKLDDAIKRVEAGSEIVEVPRGVVVKTKRSRVIEHSVSLQIDQSIQGTLSVDVFAIMKANVVGKIGETLGRTYKESETIENEITLDGKVSPKYKIVWYDKFRTGTADFTADQKLRNLHFEFREGWDLEITAIK